MSFLPIVKFLVWGGYNDAYDYEILNDSVVRVNGLSTFKSSSLCVD